MVGLPGGTIRRYLTHSTYLGLVVGGCGLIRVYDSIPADPIYAFSLFYILVR